MKTNDVAKLTGITVRTLQYYDKIGLLKPTKNTENGYRIYQESDLETLQQILFFRELDFPLSEIKEIMSNPEYDKADALKHQKELLLKKRNRLDELIDLVECTIKGERTMEFNAFDTSEIDESKEKYAQEVKERWGQTNAYAQYNQKSKKYNKEDWNSIQAEANEIMKGFAKLREEDPSSKKAQAQVKLWQDHITQRYYTCTKQILGGLGMMYVQDERFRNNINQHGEGTAEFMSKAIEAYCQEE